MKRRTWWIGTAGALAAAAGVGVSVWRRGAAEGPLPPDFWSLRFEQPGGGELMLDAYRGRPLLVNFWATWCPPCVTEMPMLDAFHGARQRDGWQVVGLAIDGPTPVREFLRQRPVGFPIGLAGLTGVELTKRLGNAGGGLPFTVVVGADGSVVARKLGALAAGDLAAWAGT